MKQEKEKGKKYLILVPVKVSTSLPGERTLIITRVDKWRQFPANIQ